MNVQIAGFVAGVPLGSGAVDVVLAGSAGMGVSVDMESPNHLELERPGGGIPRRYSAVNQRRAPCANQFGRFGEPYVCRHDAKTVPYSSVFVMQIPFWGTHMKRVSKILVLASAIVAVSMAWSAVGQAAGSATCVSPTYPHKWRMFTKPRMVKLLRCVPSTATSNAKLNNRNLTIIGECKNFQVGSAPERYRCPMRNEKGATFTGIVRVWRDEHRRIEHGTAVLKHDGYQSSYTFRWMPAPPAPGSSGGSYS